MPSFSIPSNRQPTGEKSNGHPGKQRKDLLFNKHAFFLGGFLRQ
jgi:hypothetical protein